MQRVRHARAVVLAIGYYDHPNYIRVPGEDLPHVSHYYSDAHPYFQKRVVVVGGKNSAAEAALELFRSGAQVTLVHRHATLGESIKYWVRPDIENRIKEGSIPGRMETSVVEITPTAVVVESHGVRDELPAEAVFLLTGYHPDARLMTAAGIACDPATLAPQMDPETFETNVPEPVPGRRLQRRPEYRVDLHRKRPVSRGADHQRAGAASRVTVTGETGATGSPRGNGGTATNGDLFLNVKNPVRPRSPVSPSVIPFPP